MSGSQYINMGKLFCISYTNHPYVSQVAPNLRHNNYQTEYQRAWIQPTLTQYRRSLTRHQKLSQHTIVRKSTRRGGQIPPCAAYIAINAYIQSVLFFARDAEQGIRVARHFPPSKDSDLDRLLQANVPDGAHASLRNP